jgi:alkylated DNA repair dioxygenase AlkB
MESIPIKNGFLDLDENFLSSEDAFLILSLLKEEISFESHQIKMFGKTILEPRLISWHGDSGLSYTYSKKRMSPKPWTSTLMKIKGKIEDVTQSEFNNVLLNLYRNGQDHMGWHSDDEKELGQNPLIASLSLGEERLFCLRHKFESSTPQIKLNLTHGSLLIMGGEIQHFWKHKISPSKKILKERLNLTFRFIKS